MGNPKDISALDTVHQALAKLQDRVQELEPPAVTELADPPKNPQPFQQWLDPITYRIMQYDPGTLRWVAVGEKQEWHRTRRYRAAPRDDLPPPKRLTPLDAPPHPGAFLRWLFGDLRYAWLQAARDWTLRLAGGMALVP